MADWVTAVRLVHIVAASLWLGGGVFTLTMIFPAVNTSGPAGKGFMLHVARGGGFGRFFGPASGITVLMGAILYWKDGYSKAPFGNTASIVVTIGAIIGILAFLEGVAITMPVGRKMQKLAKEVGPQGPTPAQGPEFAKLASKLNAAALRGIIMVSIVFLLMIGRLFFL
jgi:uncharacterized membrane protein